MLNGQLTVCRVAPGQVMSHMPETTYLINHTGYIPEETYLITHAGFTPEIIHPIKHTGCTPEKTYLLKHGGVQVLNGQLTVCRVAPGQVIYPR